MKTTGAARSQNVTVSLTQETFRKAKALAAQPGVSIGDLLTAQIEALVSEDEDYRQAERRARELIKQGFNMGAGLASVAKNYMNDEELL